MSHRLLPQQLNSYFRRLDSGLVFAVLLGLLAALPFLTRPGLPRGTDAELHVFRAAELGYSLASGDLYPRWAPDFYYGFGYPIFNYYAPLTYYLANLFSLLPGIGIVCGVKLVFVLGLLSASVGSYLFVRDWIGPRAGVLAAALYVLSPYVFFVDPHMRGVLAESFSLGLFPMALWAYHRALVDGRRRWIVVGAVLQAALIMSHNLLGVIFTGLLLIYLVWELGRRVIPLWRRNGLRAAVVRIWPLLRRVCGAFALGMGLSAIFWLPVVSEAGDVLLNLTGPGHFDFHNHYLTLGELLAPSPILDLAATSPRFGLNLGLAQWLLALLALLAVFWGKPAQRRLAGFFLFCSVGLIVLMLPISAPIWETVPGMAYLQFPWRLLGPAAATLSIAAAAGYGTLSEFRRGKEGGGGRNRWGAGILGLGIGLALLFALPAMFPPLWQADFGPTDPAAMIEFELTGIAVGTTSTGDYLPATVEIQPRPEPALLSTYYGPGGVDKVNRASLPKGTMVETISRGPTYDRFHVQSSKPFILRLFTFHYPGWRATVDGQAVPIELGRPEGFITVEVPSGVHTVEVRLAAIGTPARAIGTLISLLSMATLFVFAVWGRRSSSATDDRRQLDAVPTAGLDRTAALICGGVLFSFVVFKVGVVDGQHDWFRRTSPPGQVLGAQVSLVDQPVRFGTAIRLLGYDVPQTELRAGEELALTLYWQAMSPVPENYQVFAHLTKPATHLWGQSDRLNPGDIPTGRWPLDKYVRDEHELVTLPGTPPGEYQVTIGLYNMSSGVRVPVYDSDDRPVGDTFALQEPVTVTQPRHPPAGNTLALTDEIGVVFGEQITLLGTVLPDRIIEVPGFVHLALLWRAEVDGPDDMVVRVQLVDSAGRVVNEAATTPVDGRYPSSLWSNGEVVRDQYSFWLDDSVAPGPFELQVGVEGDDRWISLGWLEVLGP